jgi:flagellar biogenesis protein FliO
MGLYAEDKPDPLKDAYQGQGGQTTPPKTNEPVAAVNTWDFVNMIIGLLVVVAIIYLIFYLLKRGMGKKVVENELIKILGSRIISGTKSLHIVEVAGAVYLVGSSNDSINLISEITEKEAKDALRLSAAQTGGLGKPRFIDALASVFKPGVKKQLEINESIDFMKKQRDRLKKFKP